ncbi:NADH-quinone oxidoreductase subunit C [Mesobacillus subterraneus]|uniref:NADH-quinone oxidoreductase subunit C n=1 Tax=Mesobacillus subterraneus TaxID=285983 RepID=UPI00203E6D6F|nr:NADH-quinone oxidoreductase subunit C [Mesobacillus subterraneus]MCM3574491.1 NADH-quinone oxidoreductase subunit C [Mesobacillus subterraneus]
MSGEKDLEQIKREAAEKSKELAKQRQAAKQAGEGNDPKEVADKVAEPEVKETEAKAEAPAGDDAELAKKKAAAAAKAKAAALAKMKANGQTDENGQADEKSEAKEEVSAPVEGQDAELAKKKAAAAAKAKAAALAKMKASGQAEESTEESAAPEASAGDDDDLAKKKAAAVAKAKAAAAAKRKAQEAGAGGEIDAPAGDDDLAKKKAAAVAKAKAAAAAKRKAQEAGGEADASTDDDDLAKKKAAAVAKAKAAAAAKAKAAAGGGSADDEKAKAIAAVKAKAAAAAKAKSAAGAKAGAEEPVEEKKPSPNQPYLDKYVKAITDNLGDDILEDSYINPLSKDVPTLVAKKESYYRLAEFLKYNELLGFDYLSEIHGTDFQTHMEVYVHLYSYKNRQSVALKVKLDRDQPVIESLANLWAGANWPECEAYDLLGIKFEGHPNLHRIMLGEDWVGHPLRKDYEPYDVEV